MTVVCVAVERGFEEQRDTAPLDVKMIMYMYMYMYIYICIYTASENSQIYMYYNT